MHQTLWKLLTRFELREYFATSQLESSYCKQFVTLNDSKRNFQATLCKCPSQFIEIEINFLCSKMAEFVGCWLSFILFVLNDGIGCACVRCLSINQRKSTNHVRLISCKCISWFVPFSLKLEKILRTMPHKIRLFSVTVVEALLWFHYSWKLVRMA